MRPKRVVLGEGLVSDYGEAVRIGCIFVDDNKEDDSLIISFRKLRSKRIRLIAEILPELEEKKK